MFCLLSFIKTFLIKMAQSRDQERYDEFLTSVLVNEKSIIGFMSAIFNFLARRTDFYYIPEHPDENMGFPPGVAEELVVKVLRACDPKNWKPLNGAYKPTDVSNEIMCSTVVQEVEITADEEEESSGSEYVDQSESIQDIQNLNISDHQYSKPLPSTSESITVPNESEPVKSSMDIDKETKEMNRVEEHVEAYPDAKPPQLPTQSNSETYNGAEFDNYCWAQTITDIDITAKLPSNVKSSKDIKVIIEPEHVSVSLLNGGVLLNDSLQYKIKTGDSFWSITGGKLLIHLEKVQERWWSKLLNSEEPIDLSRIDCSRPLHDLPDDHLAKIQELQFNQQQKLLGLPTSDQIRSIEVMKKAWDADGSPFKGQPFDPNMFQ